jgi:phenylalanyl-tRNA synthetase beta chain
MKTLALNVKALYPQRIFEIGDVIHPDQSRPEKAARRLKLAAASSHSEASYSEIKSIVEEVLKNMGIDNWELRPLDSMPFIEGRAANIVWKNDILGFLGEIHPEVLINWKLTMPTAVMELDLSFIVEGLHT